ncbi:hypothetical protein M9H77_27741 [Catharanthus roseus]|uniref:Uncharacterized protein n=1 Tax=Catharanthus roseus TaxID=4058 RepID=A0ACC0ADD6_CATRO|nr:hypothetical protein M9H77_27741 [Catharanthus roseus]
MATSENWQLFVHDGRYNHKIAVYNHGHAQAARLTEEQLKQTEQFRKSHVQPLHKKYTMSLPKLIRIGCRGETWWRKFFALSVERGYTVFYRNCEDNKVLSDIVIAHPTSIAIIITWLYVLIMDTIYKTNK